MIVTLTMNPTVDVSAKVNSVSANKKLRCHSIRYDPGGGGVNVARAVKKLGGDALAVLACGGALGAMVCSFLKEEAVPHEVVSIQNEIRQGWTIDEESTDQQYRFAMPGPELSENEWQSVLDYIKSMKEKPAFLVASGSLPPGVPDDFYGRLARVCREQNIRVMVDTSGAPLQYAADEGVDLLKPNLRELETLAGRELRDEEAQEEAARELISKGKTPVVVLSLGAGGVLILSSDTCQRMRSPTVAVKSRVGAGDSTVGGIVLALDRGEGLVEAVRFGVAAGTACVMTPGTELCRREDTERIYRKMRENPAS